MQHIPRTRALCALYDLSQETPDNQKDFEVLHDIITMPVPNVMPSKVSPSTEINKPELADKVKQQETIRVLKAFEQLADFITNNASYFEYLASQGTNFYLWDHGLREATTTTIDAILDQFVDHKYEGFMVSNHNTIRICIKW